MDNNKYLPEGFRSVEEALAPATFDDSLDLAENQLFLTPWQMIMRRFFRNRLAVLGLVIIALMLVFCYIMPLFYPYSETEILYIHKETGQEVRTHETALISESILNSLQKPDAKHILGTTAMGQDMLSRLMYGGRISLMVGFVVVFVELFIGVVLGGVAGYYGKVVDIIIMRLVDILSSIPIVPLMLIIAALLITLNISPQQKIYYTMFIIGFLYWPSIARMVRGNILSLREMEFIQAANATGISVPHVIFRHLIPNTMGNLIVAATLSLGGVILLESVLSYLGVGVSLPYASWGNMVSAINDSTVMRDFPAVWVSPGICILFTVLAFNFIGDGLRDATDPRMKR